MVCQQLGCERQQLHGLGARGPARQHYLARDVEPGYNVFGRRTAVSDAGKHARSQRGVCEVLTAHGLHGLHPLAC